jgi:hypothetical protein
VDVEQALADWLGEQAGVQAAYTRRALADAFEGSDTGRQMVARSFQPERCGDIYVVLQPYCLPSAVTGTGTTHGSPWEYDTHVPLVVYGTGVQPGIRQTRVSPLSAAPILAKSAQVEPPSGAVAPVPEGLFDAGKE